MNKLEFDPAGPFPRVTYDECSYQQAQDHSVAVDEWLGFRTAEVESALLKSSAYQVQADAKIPVQFWRGLPVQALQTPYSEIRWILDLLNLQPGETVVDLGCGYGRMGFVIGKHHPGVNFIGYELVAERVSEGNRVLKNYDYPGVKIVTQDLTAPDFVPAKAQHYFLFDYGSAAAVDKTLEDLKKQAKGHTINVVARGRYTRHRIYQAHPWLAEINEPNVQETFTIFKS